MDLRGSMVDLMIYVLMMTTHMGLVVLQSAHLSEGACNRASVRIAKHNSPRRFFECIPVVLRK
jgi:hypothetical protein